MSYFATTFLWVLPFAILGYFLIIGGFGFLAFRRMYPSSDSLWEQVCAFGKSIFTNSKRQRMDTATLVIMIFGSILAMTFLIADVHTKNYNAPNVEWCNGENTVVKTNRLKLCLPTSTVGELTAIQNEQEQLNKRLDAVKKLEINRETLGSTK